MKFLAGFILALMIAGLAHYYSTIATKPEVKEAPLTAEQLQVKAKEDWETLNNANGHGISLWVDQKHNVVCYTLRSTNGGVGISCLPRNQVTGVPY